MQHYIATLFAFVDTLVIFILAGAIYSETNQNIPLIVLMSLLIIVLGIAVVYLVKYIGKTQKEREEKDVEYRKIMLDALRSVDNTMQQSNKEFAKINNFFESMIKDSVQKIFADGMVRFNSIDPNYVHDGQTKKDNETTNKDIKEYE